MAEAKLNISLNTAEFKTGLGALKSGMQDISKQCALASKQASSALEPLSGLGTRVALSIGAPMAAITALGYDTAKVIGVETKRITASLQGNAAEAAYVIQSCDDIAKRSTFGKDQLMTASRELINFGVAASDIPAKLEVLAKIGKGSGADLSELTAVYAKVAAEGKVTGEVIKGLSEKGVNVMPALASQMKVSGNNVGSALKEMGEQGKISMTDLEAAFSTMASNGGQYAADLSGSFDNASSATTKAKEDTELAAGAFVNALGPSIVKTQHLISSLCQFWLNLSDGTRETIATTASLVTVLGTILIIAPKVVSAFGIMKAAVIAFSVALNVNPIFLVITAVVALVTAVVMLTNANDEAAESQKRLDAARAGTLKISDEIKKDSEGEIDHLSKLKTASEKAAYAQKQLEYAEKDLMQLKSDGKSEGEAPKDYEDDINRQMQRISLWKQQSELYKNQVPTGGHTYTGKELEDAEATRQKWLQYVAKANNDEVELERLKNGQVKADFEKSRKTFTPTEQKGVDAAIVKQHENELTNIRTKSAKAWESSWQSACANNTNVLDKFDGINKAVQDGTMKGWEGTAAKIAAVFTSSLSAVSNLMNSIFAAQTQAAEQKYSKLSAAETAYNNFSETQNAKSFVKMSAKEKAEYNLKNASSKAEKKRSEDLAKEKNKIARKQAIATKATGIFEAGINVALSVVRAFSDYAFPASAIIASLVGALGAVQIAAIASAPLPALAAGGAALSGASTAVIGEAGKELVVPLESANGRNAIKLFMDQFISGLNNKMNQYSSEIQPYANNTQINRANALNNKSSDGNAGTIVKLVALEGDEICNRLFTLTKDGRLLIANSAVVSTT